MLLRTGIVGITLLLSFAYIGESAKILAIFPYPGQSQYIVVTPYLKALAARGHEVTSINAYPQKTPIKNFRDIPIPEVFQEYDGSTLVSAQNNNKWEKFKMMTEYILSTTNGVFSNKQVQELIKSKTEKFDLVIVETLYNEALYGFGAHFKAPLIGFSSFGTDSEIDGYVGNISPPSFIPILMEKLSDRMTFCERFNNILQHAMSYYFMHKYFFPQQVEIYKRNFPHLKEDIMELRKNFSLIFVNQHFSISFPRPYVPNMIEVSGFHIHHVPKPLPDDMREFIENSKHGVIYFSLGSNVLSTFLPKETLQLLMEIFASLKQNVMWKFEDPELPGKPDNVFISKWFPQPDILAHPNVKLFITHCGLLSTTEAIYHGKPLVGLPVFVDQFMNLHRIKTMGIGLGIDLVSIDKNNLKSYILEVLNNPSYTEKVTVLSRRYRDQPQPPLEKAIYWTEYVLRHNGATHMRVAVQDMTFIAKHSIDTIGLLVLIALTVVFVTILIIYKVIKFFIGKGNNQTKRKKQ